MTIFTRLIIIILSFTIGISDCDIGDCENGWGKFIYNNDDIKEYYEGYWVNGK